MKIKELLETLRQLVVEIKKLQQRHVNCTQSIDCQCDSCVDDWSRTKEGYCVRSVDCQCDFCLKEWENPVKVIESMVEPVKRDDHSSECVDLTKMEHELNKCVKIVDGSVDECGEQKVFDKSSQRGEMRVQIDIVPQRSKDTQVISTEIDMKDQLSELHLDVNTFSQKYGMTTTCVKKGERLEFPSCNEFSGNYHILFRARLSHNILRMLNNLTLASLDYCRQRNNIRSTMSFDPGGITFYVSDSRYMKSIEFIFPSSLSMDSQLKLLSRKTKIVLNWLKQFMVLLDGVKILHSVALPWFVFSLYFGKTEFTNNAQVVNKWIMRGSIGLPDLCRENIKSDIGDSRDNSLASFLLGWDNLLLITTLGDWAINCWIMYNEQEKVPLDLMSQMHEFMILNSADKRQNQKLCMEALSDLLALGFVNLVTTTLLKLQETNEEYSDNLTFQLLKWLFHDLSKGGIIKNARVKENADSYMLLNDITIFECLLNCSAVVASSHEVQVGFHSLLRCPMASNKVIFSVEHIVEALLNWNLKYCNSISGNCDDNLDKGANDFKSKGKQLGALQNIVIASNLVVVGLDKGTKEVKANVLENLSSSDDVHYRLGSLETLELHKKIGSANQRKIAEGCGGMFSVGEEFKERVQCALKNGTTDVLTMSAADIVDVLTSIASFSVVVTSGTIYIKGCGTKSLQGYFNLTVNLKKLVPRIWTLIFAHMKFPLLILLINKMRLQMASRIYKEIDHIQVWDFSYHLNTLTRSEDCSVHISGWKPTIGVIWNVDGIFLLLQLVDIRGGCDYYELTVTVLNFGSVTRHFRGQANVLISFFKVFFSTCGQLLQMKECLAIPGKDSLLVIFYQRWLIEFNVAKELYTTEMSLRKCLEVPFDPGGNYFGIASYPYQYISLPIRTLDETKDSHGNKNKKSIEMGEIQFFIASAEQAHVIALLFSELQGTDMVDDAFPCENANS